MSQSHFVQGRISLGCVLRVHNFCGLILRLQEIQLLLQTMNLGQLALDQFLSTMSDGFEQLPGFAVHACCVEVFGGLRDMVDVSEEIGGVGRRVLGGRFAGQRVTGRVAQIIAIIADQGFACQWAGHGCVGCQRSVVTRCRGFAAGLRGGASRGGCLFKKIGTALFGTRLCLTSGGGGIGGHLRSCGIAASSRGGGRWAGSR